MINSAWESPDVFIEYSLRFGQHGLEGSKFYKEYISSLASLLPRDFAVFEILFLHEYYTEREHENTNTVSSFTDSDWEPKGPLVKLKFLCFTTV